MPSIQESIHRGVPMVVIPFLYDQFDNAEMVEEKGIGKYLDRDALTVENIQNSILEIIENQKYKRNVLRLSQMVKDEPIAPRDKAVWHIEYAIRNKDALHQLKYKGVTLPFYQRYLLDVVCVMLLVFAIILYLLRISYNWIKKRAFFTIKVQVKVKKS